MKKPKLIIKVDSNRRGKVYCGKKWHKDVCEIDLYGEPFNYTLTLKVYKRNKQGGFFVTNNEIATKTKVFRI